MTHIAFYLADNMLATSVALPLEQLRAAEQIHGRGDRAPRTRIRPSLISEDGRPVQSHAGLKLCPDASLEDLPYPDIVFLPALWRNPQPVIRASPKLLRWLPRAAAAGSIVIGVGTGCCFMAEAGLLAGRPATTHWYYFEQFARRYPQVLLKRQQFITRSNNFYCAASVNALADLTIHFVAQLFDTETARRVERHFFHEIKRASDPALVGDATDTHPDEAIAEAQAWLMDHAATAVVMAELPARWEMSLRTFNRRFKAATNMTPGQYLQRARLRQASEMLHSTNLAIAEVGFRAGYGDATHFSTLFKQHYGLTPSQYRATVRAKLFSAS